VSTVWANLRRKFPGWAWRKNNANNDVQFLKGRVIHAGWGMTGPVTQTIETESKFIPLVKLIGDTYAYWCNACGVTVYEQELILRARAGADCDIAHYVKSAKVTEQKCPFCYNPIRPLQRGDKVLVHYRFDQNGQWAAWWAERWEW
jgi:hypothetical protein